MCKKNKVLSKKIEVVKKQKPSYKVLKTISILAGDKKYQLIKEQEIPSGIPSEFVDSLRNTNLIK